MTLLAIAQSSYACSSAIAPAVDNFKNTINPTCEYEMLGVDDLANSLWLQREFNKAKEEKSDYWSDWAFKLEGEPIVTGRLKSNYVGLGLWRPKEFAEIDKDLAYDEWLITHGLQFSVGLGDQNGTSPRMRFDYRWHNQSDNDFLVQLEFPF